MVRTGESDAVPPGHCKGELFVVSAPSGAGKTVLCQAVCRRLSGLFHSISHTTRPMRVGEREGVDYFFVDETAFQEMVDRGEFLEWAFVHGHRYGTSRRWIHQKLGDGADVILDVDVQGAEQLAKLDLPAHFIFLLPPSRAALEERLRGRGTESRAEIARRLEQAKVEIQRWRRYDFIIVNDVLEEAVRNLEGLIRAQRCRRERCEGWIERKFEGWIRTEA